MPPSGIVKSMMRVFKTRHFQRWLRKTELTDAVEEMADGAL